MSTAGTSNLTAEERERLIAKVKAMSAEKRARGELAAPSVSPEEALAALEDDHRAGRVLKWDTRLSAEEKDRMYRAANALGLTASEFVRDVVAKACDEILAADDPMSDEGLLKAIGVS